MSRLEDAVKPFLEAALSGRGRTLHAEGQQALATWAFKTALMINGLFNDHATGIPADHYTHLFERQAPPENVVVWLSAVEPDAPAHLYTAGMAVSRPGERVTDADSPNVYTVTFTLGPLLFQVFGVDDPDAIRIDPRWGEYRDPRVQRIWPYARSFTWTPRPAMDLQDLERFAFAVYETVLAHVKSTQPRATPPPV